MVSSVRLSMSSVFRSAVVLGLVALATACGKSPSAPSSTVTITDLVAGTGTAAAAGSFVTINYTGWLFNSSQPDNRGTQFDTSVGKTPLSFFVGFGSVIEGLDTGIVGMKVGGSRRLQIPPDLAYGSSGSGGIPGNATLIFDIQLLKVQ